MSKLFAVFKREYLQAVRKKMFIIMTFLLPLLMAALFVLPSLMMMKGLGEKKVVVLDGTGKLAETFTKPIETGAPAGAKKAGKSALPELVKVEYIDRHADPAIEQTAKPYLERMTQNKKSDPLDGVLVIPADALTNHDAKLRFYSRSATDFVVQERLSSMSNRGVQRFRLEARGISPADIDSAMSEMKLEAVQVSKSGEQKKGGAENFYVGFILTGLLIIPSFIYGLEIMRGIIQEKTDRVVEVLISSMSPSQLLVGKILGVAAVGLTQVTVWMIMAGVAGFAGAQAAAAAGVNILQFLRISTFLYFIVFFLLAYMTYVCVYAIGGAICNSEKEAQQLIAPISMLMMLPWFLMVGLITNPDSTLAIAFSMAPVFGPMTMFVRTLVAEPPVWHIVVTILVSIGTIAAFFWVTAKIFRVGILSYGKRPTIPELWRWLKVA
jgi:ABC-2 type transport system permease protein